MVSALKEFSPQAETAQTGSLWNKTKGLPGSFRQVTELLGGSPDEQLVGSRAAQGSGPRRHFVGHWVTEGISHKGRVLLSQHDRVMMKILLSNSSVIGTFLSVHVR